MTPAHLLPCYGHSPPFPTNLRILPKWGGGCDVRHTHAHPGLLGTPYALVFKMPFHVQVMLKNKTSTLSMPAIYKFAQLVKQARNEGQFCPSFFPASKGPKGKCVCKRSVNRVGRAKRASPSEKWFAHPALRPFVRQFLQRPAASWTAVTSCRAERVGANAARRRVAADHMRAR